MLTFFQQKFQHICVSLDVNFNGSLTNYVVIVSFEQLDPGCYLLEMSRRSEAVPMSNHTVYIGTNKTNTSKLSFYLSRYLDLCWIKSFIALPQKTYQTGSAIRRLQMKKARNLFVKHYVSKYMLVHTKCQKKESGITLTKLILSKETKNK